jgi:hypothetical protein
MSVTLEELTKLILEQAKEKGFGTTPEEINVPEKIALIHAQISSAYEGYRKKKITGEWSLEDELAGAVQRIIHLCAVLDLDLEAAIIHKIEANKNREWDWKEMNEKHS